MSIEIVLSGAAIVGVILTTSGLVLAWRRNGTHQAQRDMAQAEVQATRDANIASNQNAILDRLDDKESGLQAVNIKVGEIHEDTAVLTQRVDGHDREVKDMKKVWTDSVLYLKGLKESK